MNNQNQNSNNFMQVTSIKTQCDSCEALKKALIEGQKQLKDQVKTLSEWSCLSIH